MAESKEQVQVFICTSEDMHPYECDGPGKCKHCDQTKNATHDPNICALCQYMTGDGESNG